MLCHPCDIFWHTFVIPSYRLTQIKNSSDLFIKVSGQGGYKLGVLEVVFLFVFLSRIAEIAEHSVRFLDLVMLPSSGSSDGLKNDHDNRPMPSYDTELTALHDLISHAVSILLADSANSVKQALMEHSVTKLAVFFGKQKANDVILSHMITFLNDKEDSQVRNTIF